MHSICFSIRFITIPARVFSLRGAEHAWALSTVLAVSLAAQPASATTVTDGQIAQLQSYHQHTGLLVSLDVPYNSAEGCTGGGWYILPDNSVRAALVQSMLITAQASRKTVRLVATGCYEGYPKVVDVTLS